MTLIQYIKDTRSELNHVAWPTRLQTIIYTILVIALSILIALYLGLFDYLFTTGLGKAVEALPQAAPAENQIQLENMELAPLEEGSGEQEAAPIQIQ